MPSAEPPSPRARARSRRWIAALAALLAIAAFAWAFDWNWFRPAIQHYVMSHSGRRFDFDDLKVHFDHSLDPTIEFRGLAIQNAPWAASHEPFLRAGHVAATVSWRSLGSDMTIVTLIVLEDAQVDMERHADGLRNWRLGHPDDRGPPKVRVLALDARRSTLHTIHDGIGLVGDAAIAPLPQPQAVPDHADLPLTKHLVFKGTYKGHAFDVASDVSDVLAFGATARRFSLNGTGHAGGVRLDAAGTSTSVTSLADFDVDATLASVDGGVLWPLPEALGRARPLAARGHVSKIDMAWTATGLHATLGKRTALAGDVHFTGSLKDDTQRRILNATLRDVVLDTDDLRALAGKSNDGKTTTPAAPMISATPLPTARLRTFDADVDLKDARIVGPDSALAQSLRLHATLAQGRLRVDAFDLGAADGHVTGTLQFDGMAAPNTLALDLTAHAIDLAALSPKLAKGGSLIARADAHAQLRSHGDSPRALAAALAGTVTASLAPGASVSKRLDAKLSLDGGEWLRSLFDKSDRVPVQCAEVTLAVDHGIGTTRRFAFETEHTALAGGGSANLADEAIDVTVTPVRKTTALLALDRAIHAQGPWRDIRIKLESPPAGAAPQRCAATAVAQH